MLRRGRGKPRPYRNHADPVDGVVRFRELPRPQVGLSVPFDLVQGVRGVVQVAALSRLLALCSVTVLRGSGR